MSTIEQTTTKNECGTCGEPLSESGRCLNVECSAAVEEACRTAARETRKASAPPRAFTFSGNVD
jgi:hypothetical protein